MNTSIRSYETFDEWWDAAPEPTKGHATRTLHEAFEDCWNAGYERGKRGRVEIDIWHGDDIDDDAKGK